MLAKSEEHSMWDDLSSSHSSLIDPQCNERRSQIILDPLVNPKKKQRKENKQASAHNLSFESELKAHKKDYLQINEPQQKEMITRIKTEQKKLLQFQSQRIQQLEQKYFKDSKKIQNLKAPSISLENKVMESYLISNNDNPLPKTVKSKSIRMKRGSSKADKSIDQPQSKKDRFLWSEQNELILILLLSLQAFSQTMVTALLPYRMEECQFYLKRNLYRLYNNLMHKQATQLSRNRSYLDHYNNPVLIDLFHQYIRKHPQPSNEASIGDTHDFKYLAGEYKPILSNLKWKELQL